MADKITLIVADDHPLYREGVVRTLSAEPDIAVAAVGASADEALSLVAARRIADAYPAVSIIMLTVSEQDDDVHAALKAGARGYVLKGVGGAELVGLIRGVAKGESYVSPSLAARLLMEAGTGGVAAPADRLAGNRTRSALESPDGA